VEGKNLGRVYYAPLDVHLGDHVVQPDILFISKERFSIIAEEAIKYSKRQFPIDGGR